MTIRPAPKAPIDGDRGRCHRIQVKICGLTRVADAVGCVTSGADAIGCVFFPKSPRNVTPATAREISRAVLPRVNVVGVFVNAGYTTIMKAVDTCHLTAVQLHGQESPDLVTRLRQRGIPVTKALFIDGRPPATRATDYPASAFLLECAKGPLPGGNAMAWRYETVSVYDRTRPLILAGGLSPDTVARAIEQARPDAVDVSSGVETSPGVKSMASVRDFIATVRAQCLPDHIPRTVFGPVRTGTT